MKSSPRRLPIKSKDFYARRYAGEYDSRRCGLSSLQCGATDRHDGCRLAYCCYRPHQGADPADDGPAGGKVQKADPWQTVMLSDRGDDQRRYVEAEHGAEREVEADQIADAIDKAFHRLLSTAATRDSRRVSER